ncbi:MAG: hypothetical protein R3B70_38905 [Polyangiaceae bacterium]
MTTWEIIWTSPREHDPLLRDLRAGLPVGIALSRFLSKGDLARRRLRMCLLGDPDLRLAPVHKNSSPAERQSMLQPGRARDLEGVGFLRALVAMMGPSVPPAQLENVANASRLVEMYEARSWLGAPTESEEAPFGAAMRGAVLDLVVSRGRLTGDWLPVADQPHTREPPEARCAACGDRTSVLVARLRLAGRPRRRVVLCPTCGFLEDAPAHARLWMCVEAGAIELRGDLPASSWLATLALVSRDARLTRRWVWPADGAGAPVPRFVPPPPWPVGPSRLALFFMHRAELIVFGRPLRASETFRAPSSTGGEEAI